jgi:hypothetical protein
MRCSWLYGFPIVSTGFVPGSSPSIGRPRDGGTVTREPLRLLLVLGMPSGRDDSSFGPMEALRFSELQNGEKELSRYVAPREQSKRGRTMQHVWPRARVL